MRTARPLPCSVEQVDDEARSVQGVQDRKGNAMYGYIWRAQQPIETYNAMHREVVDLVGSNDPEGLLVHLVYGTEQGFNMVEVWESKEQSDAFSRDIISQVYQRLGIPTDGPPQDVTEFEPVEVITPQVRTPTSH